VTRASYGEGARQVEHAVKVVQDPARGLEQAPARGGQAHAAAGAVEQAHPELCLKLAYTLGDRRWRDVQPPGGPGEVQLLGHSDEEGQVPAVHPRPSPMIPPGRIIQIYRMVSGGPLIDPQPGQ